MKKKKAIQCFCFFFTFIEHKNFWQNAKSKCVFLLSSVSIQYLHRWQTDIGVVAYLCLTYIMSSGAVTVTSYWQWRLKSPVWLNMKQLGVTLLRVCVGDSYCEPENLGRLFFSLSNPEKFMLLCLLANAEQDEKIF